MQPKYRIYPSLLDSYEQLLDYETVVEEPWNRVSDAAHGRGEYLDKEVGDYKLNPDEMYVKLEADLIDSVNRIDGEPSEAADKGTCFNEIVDCLIENRRSSRDDVKIHSCANDKGIRVIRAEMDGFTFDFDVNFCKAAAAYFMDSLPQYRVCAVLHTKYGDVEIYGYLDEWRGNKIFDIKTTSYYDFGKFARKWQKVVYPWAVITSGVATEVESFEYSVFKLNKDEVIKGDFYREVYDYDHATAEIKLRAHVESFIEWLEFRRPFITDKRIFYGINPEDYVGVPINPELLIPTLQAV